jgi:hypothetical protein
MDTLNMATNYIETKILATLTNVEDGMEAIVAQITYGFSVVVRDIDSGMIFPQVFVYKTEAEAMVKAQKVL